MKEIVVWVVYGDDHDYDYMSQWLVGVYFSEAEADQAAKDDDVRYLKEGGRKTKYGSCANYNIESTILRIPEGTVI